MERQDESYFEVGHYEPVGEVLIIKHMQIVYSGDWNAIYLIADNTTDCRNFN